jgi:hypothetical protein
MSNKKSGQLLIYYSKLYHNRIPLANTTKRPKMDRNVRHKMRSGEPPFCATYSIRQQNLIGIGLAPIGGYCVLTVPKTPLANGMAGKKST